MIRRFLIFVIYLWHYFLSQIVSSIFGQNSSCRFYPTCSDYTVGAIEKFGVVKGLTLGFSRVLKCHPWGKTGADFTP